MTEREPVDDSNYIDRDPDSPTIGDVLPNDNSIFMEPKFKAEVFDHYMSKPADQLDDFVDVDDLSKSEKAERLVQVDEFEGFYPHSNDELSRVITMQGNADTDKRALIHLDEVYAHQRKADTESPSDALKSIVRTFETYANNSAVEAGMLGMLKRELIQASDKKKALSFKNVKNMEGWKDQETTKRGLMIVSRYLETKDFAENDGQDMLGKNKIIDKASNKDERITNIINDLRVSTIEDAIDAIITQEAHRYEYWLARLRESAKHYFVRGQAYDAIEKLESKYGRTKPPVDDDWDN